MTLRSSVLAAAALALLAGGSLPERDDAPERDDPAAAPTAFERRGRLVCIAEEMKAHYGVDIPPVHDHLVGFRVEGRLPEGSARYYTVLRTNFSKALFEDPRYAAADLVLSGRVFPGAAVLEVTRFRWVRDGKLFELFYWCEVCSIKGVDPGPCACCQGEVEFRERELDDPPPPAK